MSHSPSPGHTDDEEIRRLLEDVFRQHGYDFREYALSSMRRRVRDRVRAEGVNSTAELRVRIMNDPDALDRFLLGLSVSVSAIFRDPAFYASFRANVVPRLRTYPFARVWHAGCSTGEEVYSMAILLQEEGLYDRCRIYATDINEVVLQRAREGIYPLAAMRQYTRNYLQAGGQGEFSTYYTASYRNALFRPSLRQNIVFAPHNLAIEGSFNEFHVIMCRNVMIYFEKGLQRRVHQLLLESLVPFGYLCLGNRESLAGTGFESHYEAIDPDQRIFRKIA